jgi:hypothetical protein
LAGQVEPDRGIPRPAVVRSQRRKDAPVERVALARQIRAAQLAVMHKRMPRTVEVILGKRPRLA